MVLFLSCSLQNFFTCVPSTPPARRVRPGNTVAPGGSCQRDRCQDPKVKMSNSWVSGYEERKKKKLSVCLELRPNMEGKLAEPVLFFAYLTLLLPLANHLGQELDKCSSSRQGKEEFGEGFYLHQM